MITADELTKITNLTPGDLSMVLHDSGYTGCNFESAHFIGITNGGQFCYRVFYYDEADTGESEEGKVFITYNHAKEMTADF